MLQSQLKDCLTRGEKLTEKHEKYMEREDKVLQKLDEISSRQASTEKGLLLQRSSTLGNAILNQSAKCVKDDIIEYVSQNPPNRAFRNQFAWNSTEVMNHCWTYLLRWWNTNVEPSYPAPLGSTRIVCVNSLPLLSNARDLARRRQQRDRKKAIG